jgi:hypothetical protein
VRQELAYKAETLGSALDVLAKVADSKLRPVYRAIEGDAQAVWRRRLELHASDLVRFGRTYRHWRNSQVPMIESVAQCHDQLLALSNPQAAADMATDAGTREVAHATVVTAVPLVLDVESRRITDGTRVVLLHVNDQPCAESQLVSVAFQKGSFKFDGLSIGPLTRVGIPADAPSTRLHWSPQTQPTVKSGDRLVLASFAWFSDNAGNRYLNVDRPKADDVSAPKPACQPDSYVDNSYGHKYCCKPHEVAEAEWSDELAARRARGELNPKTWPPVRDGDAFDVRAAGSTVIDPAGAPPVPPPDDLTIDDVE